MMDTTRFKSKTEYIARDNGRIPGAWELAIDLGYGGVKLLSPNIVATFPNYARRDSGSFSYVGSTPESSIVYKDLETGEHWVVGEMAQETIDAGGMLDTELSLYGRERYSNPMFLVCARAGMGIGMLSNEFGAPEDDELSNEPEAPEDDKIVIQTGLPERFMSDEPDIREALQGRHHFALRIGSDGWREFDFEVAGEDIYVMSQPKGSLFSVCILKDGLFHPDAEKYLSSSVIVFDPGFGTLDLFSIRKGAVDRGETSTNLGMKRIFQETSALIKSEYGVDLPVVDMQRHLQSGTVRYVDRKKMVSKECKFDGFLYQATEAVCNEAIEWMLNAVNIADYDYMIVTGGTGAAWMRKIMKKMEGFDTLQIIPGNQNDDLSGIYSNVRGYYLYRFNKLKEARNAGRGCR